LNWVERWLMNNPVRVRIQARVVDWMKSGGELGSGGRVVDIGCGRGSSSVLVAQTFQARLVAALDLDPKQLRAARKYLFRQARSPVHLVQSGTLNLPLADQSMDAAFSFGMLHHVIQWRKALDEIHRVLVPGGLFFFEEYYPATYANVITRRLMDHPKEDRFVGPDLLDALTERRLEPLRIRDIRGYSIRAVCRKG
jgi:ubiquinone/menaquinone biosynthesis C-methylase UbiE